MCRSILRIFLFILFLSRFLFSVEIEFKDVVVRNIVSINNVNLKKISYQIYAKKYFEKYTKNSKLLFLVNRKLFMLKNNFFMDGIFKSKKTLIQFKIAYILLDKVYLFDVNGTIDSFKVSAKEVVFDGYKSFILKKCEVKKDKYIYRRNIFKIMLN